MSDRGRRFVLSDLVRAGVVSEDDAWVLQRMAVKAALGSLTPAERRAVRRVMRDVESLVGGDPVAASEVVVALAQYLADEEVDT